jgi:hypothetical protein
MWEVNRHFRNEWREYLGGKINECETTYTHRNVIYFYVGALVNLRRVTSLELV